MKFPVGNCLQGKRYVLVNRREKSIDQVSCLFRLYSIVHNLRLNIFHLVFFTIKKASKFVWGGGQKLERLNVERPIFRKFESSNIEITKVELFDFSISEFILYFYDCLNYSNTQNTYLINYHQIRNFLNFDSFTNCQIF